MANKSSDSKPDPNAGLMNKLHWLQLLDESETVDEAVEKFRQSLGTVCDQHKTYHNQMGKLRKIVQEGLGLETEDPLYTAEEFRGNVQLTSLGEMLLEHYLEYKKLEAQKQAISEELFKSYKPKS